MRMTADLLKREKLATNSTIRPVLLSIATLCSILRIRVSIRKGRKRSSMLLSPIVINLHTPLGAMNGCEIVKRNFFELAPTYPQLSEMLQIDENF